MIKKTIEIATIDGYEFAKSDKELEMVISEDAQIITLIYKKVITETEPTEPTESTESETETESTESTEYEPESTESETESTESETGSQDESNTGGNGEGGSHSNNGNSTTTKPGGFLPQTGEEIAKTTGIVGGGIIAGVLGILVYRRRK